MVRLYVDGEDYGKMTEKAAELYKKQHFISGNNEPIRIEPASEEEPDFLPSDETTGTADDALSPDIVESVKKYLG